MSAQPLPFSATKPGFPEAVAAAIEKVVMRTPGERIGLHEPHFGDPITHDDLLDFHTILQDEESLAAAMDTLLGR